MHCLTLTFGRVGKMPFAMFVVSASNYVVILPAISLLRSMTLLIQSQQVWLAQRNPTKKVIMALSGKSA